MTTQNKFTFDTEFLGAEDRPAPAARARQKQTLTTEELDNLQTLPRLEGENNAQARGAEALERSIAALTISVRAALDQSHAEIEILRDDAARLALAEKVAPAARAPPPPGILKSGCPQAFPQAMGGPRVPLRAAPAVTEV